MSITTSEIIAAQNTDDFCQTAFATMQQAKLLFFKDHDGTILGLNLSIPELDHIVSQKRLPTSLAPHPSFEDGWSH